MAISYHIYGNDGQGGAIDYATVIATVPAASAAPVGSFTTAPLAAPSDHSFAVRAFDDVSGVEEANTDARVRVVIDAQGRDVSSQPNAVLGLAVRWAVGEVGLVSWGYTPAGQGATPTRFDVFASTGPTPPGGATPPAASVAYTPGVLGYGCRLRGLTTGTDWTIGVRAVGSTDAMVSSLTSIELAKQSGALGPVEGLVATASA